MLQHKCEKVSENLSLNCFRMRTEMILSWYLRASINGSCWTGMVCAVFLTLGQLLPASHATGHDMSKIIFPQ